MEKIGTGKILNHMDRIYGKQKPITADLFISNSCNNKCKYCSYKKKHGENEFMLYDDFRSIIYRLKCLGVEGVILTGGGEPTLNPDLEKIADYLNRNKYHWGINTNFNEIKYIKPDFLKVSLDAWDEDSYEKVRGVRNYEKTIENIKEYSKWRKRYNNQTLLGIQMVATSVLDIDKFYNAHKDLDVDYISFRPVESRQGRYYKNEFVDANNDPYIIQLYLKQLSQKDSRVQANYKWNLIKKREKSCSANWAQIAVDVDGNVLCCCHKPNEIVGHIQDKDILEKKKNYKVNMQTCDMPCRLSGPNIEYSEFKRSIKPAFFI